jgi:hypothetical protein
MRERQQKIIIVIKLEKRKKTEQKESTGAQEGSARPYRENECIALNELTNNLKNKKTSTKKRQTINKMQNNNSAEFGFEWRFFPLTLS